MKSRPNFLVLVKRDRKKNILERKNSHRRRLSVRRIKEKINEIVQLPALASVALVFERNPTTRLTIDIAVSINRRVFHVIAVVVEEMAAVVNASRHSCHQQ